jgi:hypothetical protein
VITFKAIVGDYGAHGHLEGRARLGDKSCVAKGPRHTTSRGFPLSSAPNRVSPSKQKGRTSHARDARCLRVRSITLACIYKDWFLSQNKSGAPLWGPLGGENPVDGPLFLPSSPLKAAAGATIVALSDQRTHMHIKTRTIAHLLKLSG